MIEIIIKKQKSEKNAANLTIGLAIRYSILIFSGDSIMTLSPFKYPAGLFCLIVFSFFFNF